MTRFLLACVAALMLAQPVAATSARIIGEAEFQALSEGNTMYFSQNGRPYGQEQFFANRESYWRFDKDTCVRGEWYAKGPEICFVYEHNNIPQCWLFSERGGSYYARLSTLAEGDPSELKLEYVDQEPLDCLAPDLGV